MANHVSTMVIDVRLYNDIMNYMAYLRRVYDQDYTFSSIGREILNEGLECKFSKVSQDIEEGKGVVNPRYKKSKNVAIVIEGGMYELIKELKKHCFPKSSIAIILRVLLENGIEKLKKEEGIKEW